MKPVEIHFRSTGSSGNIFFLLGIVQTAMRKQRRISAYNELRDRVLDAPSYSNALSIIREYVNLIDNDGIY